ncbi:MAG TPA: hypothetical protein VF943_02280 [Burkholderiales bacterium]
MREHRRFLALLALFAALLAALPLLDFALIVRSGEYERLDRVVQLQHETGALYGSALHDTRGELPLEIVRHRQPEIIALGSSRPLDFRQEYFTHPFACACGGMDSIEDGETYMQEILARARPKLVLFALDFWWFTTPEPHRRSPMNLEATGELTRAKILRPLEWVWEGTLTPREYLRLLGGERNLFAAVPRPKIGVMAIKRGIGLRADGSLLHGIRLGQAGLDFYAPMRAQVLNARRFVMTEGRRKGEPTRFGPDNVLYPERLRSLDRVLAKLKAGGVRVILLLPPVAPSVAKAMAESGRHTVLADLDRELRARGLEYHNFHDPAALHSGVCEFADAYHAGNVTYMRMLRAMLQARPSSPLAPYVDRQRIDAAIARYAGRTIVPFESDGELPPEVDFLGAGCRRGA